MKTATVYQDGANQVVRFPEDFHIVSKKMYIHTVGNTVVLLPEDDPWEPLFASLNQFTDDFMSEREQPAFDNP